MFFQPGKGPSSIFQPARTSGSRTARRLVSELSFARTRRGAGRAGAAARGPASATGAACRPRRPGDPLQVRGDRNPGPRPTWPRSRCGAARIPSRPARSRRQPAASTEPESQRRIPRAVAKVGKRRPLPVARSTSSSPRASRRSRPGARRPRAGPPGTRPHAMVLADAATTRCVPVPRSHRRSTPTRRVERLVVEEVESGDPALVSPGASGCGVPAPARERLEEAHRPGRDVPDPERPPALSRSPGGGDPRPLGRHRRRSSWAASEGRPPFARASRRGGRPSAS